MRGQLRQRRRLKEGVGLLRRGVGSAVGLSIVSGRPTRRNLSASVVVMSSPVRLRLLVWLSVLRVASSASAHPGGLDGDGCHYDRERARFHCHRGTFSGQAFESRDKMPAPHRTIPGSQKGPSPRADRLIVRVTAVIDRDTIEVCWVRDRTERVRYIGMNTPETRRSSRRRKDGGREATDANKRLVGARDVRLELERPGTRSARPTPRICLGRRHHGQRRAGASRLRRKDDRTAERPSSKLLKLQREARESRRGLWAR